MVNSSLNCEIMLRSLHKISYQEFLTELLKTRDQITAKDLDTKPPLELGADLQKIFQEKIMNLNSDDLEPELVSRWQSLQTEIYRSFRLLTTDLMFLRSSVQSTTAQARLVKVTERLDQIIAYCQVILTLETTS